MKDLTKCIIERATNLCLLGDNVTNAKVVQKMLQIMLDNLV
jgi:hypothetical protein